MPMKKKTTPYLPIRTNDNSKKKAICEPGREVIKFLQLFARNYHVESKLPEGLQEIIVG